MLDDYFRQPGLARLLTAIRDKYRSLGRMAGHVRLADLTDGEREVLSGLLGRSLAGADSVTVGVELVDRILRESRFGVSLMELLPAYFGEALVHRGTERAEIRNAWEGLFAPAGQLAGDSPVAAWLNELRSRKGEGYRTLQTLFGEDRPNAAKILCLVTEALMRLPGREPCAMSMRLPVFAACLAGDPHAFDPDRLAGRLLLSGIAYVTGGPVASEGAEGRRKTLRRAGLLDDDVSSQVLVAGLRLAPDDPCAPMLENAAQTATPLALTLRFMLDPGRAGWEPLPEVWVVENPSIFSVLLDAHIHPVPPLVCPSGQPSTAAYRLLDQLAAGGGRICYGGDFDLGGLEIGAAMANRYGHAFQPWLFDTASYRWALERQERDAVALPRFEASQLNRLRSFHVPWDEELVRVMSDYERPAYQEALVEKFIQWFG